jgi:hypothetical protein
MKGKKTGGRKAGTPNRTTEEIRQSLLQLLDNNIDNLQADIEALEAKERVSLLISLAKHCTPPALNPEKLTDEQLLQIIDYIKSNEKNTQNT